MQSLIIKSMLVVALLIGCFRPISLTNGNPEGPSTAHKSTATGCDFSAYAPVRIKQFDPKAVIKRVLPNYPAEAAEDGIQGQVLVKALVNEKGIVERACAVEGEVALRKAAETAALQWKLKPKYGLAFVRPKTRKNPQNFAEVYLAFEFKLNTGLDKEAKETAAKKP